MLLFLVGKLQPSAMRQTVPAKTLSDDGASFGFSANVLAQDARKPRCKSEKK